MKGISKIIFLFIGIGSYLMLPQAHGDNTQPLDISGVWMPTIIAPDGSRTQRFPEIMPYLPEVQTGIDKYRENYNPLVDDSSRSCLPYGMPRQILLRAQYPLEIIQTNNHITMLTELHNDVRRIYLDQRKKPEGLLPSWMGYSIGHWKKTELIIETTALRERGLPNPQSTETVLQERYRLVDSKKAGEMLELELTINDPKVYSGPLVVRHYFRRYADLQMGEYFCSEDVWRQNLDGRNDAIPWR